ncbi:MAG: M14 family metallopeptidase [Bacillota bacterium]|jgi:murein tripeptide amidase MpaA
MTKVAYNPAKYYTYAEYVELLNQWHAAYPEMTRVYSIGKTYEGREMWLIEITNHATGCADDKPGYYIDGNFHAGEVTGSAVALYTANYLLENYGKKDDVTYLLDHRSFYILPRVSIDGSEVYLHTPYIPRSSIRVWPFEEEQDGLHAEDMNGDGWITQMRIKDENGDWKVSEKDPRLMLRRGPDDFGGEYYRVYMEGKLVNFDGVEVTMARPKWGLDINRNSPANWEIDSKQRGAGPYPFSEPELKAVADFIISKKNLAGAMSYHTSGGVHLRPFGTKRDDRMPGRDADYYKTLGARGEEFSGYKQVNTFEGYSMGRPLYGLFMDWVYEHRGLLCWSTELWNMAATAGVEKTDIRSMRNKTPQEIEADGLKLLEWNDKELNGEGFIPWTPFNHPDLGEVEIGGWKTKYVRQNPPPKYLEAECDKNMRFTFVHALALPEIGIRKVKVEQVGEGLYRISAGVINKGYLPSSGSDMAARINVTQPVEATIAGEGINLPVGKEKIEIGHLPGRAEKKVEWLVQAPAGSKLTITAHGHRAGKATVEVELK